MLQKRLIWLCVSLQVHVKICVKLSGPKLKCILFCSCVSKNWSSGATPRWPKKQALAKKQEHLGYFQEVYCFLQNIPFTTVNKIRAWWKGLPDFDQAKCSLRRQPSMSKKQKNIFLNFEVKKKNYFSKFWDFGVLLA